MFAHAITTVSLRRLVSTPRCFALVVLLVLTLSVTASLASSPSATTSKGKVLPYAAVDSTSCAAAGTWYIIGGYHLDFIYASYSLDLTIPWDTAEPPWVQLPSPPNITTTSCIISINGTYPFEGHQDSVISFFGNEDETEPFMNLYDVSSQTWLQNTSTMVTVPARSHDQVPVGDPIDGKIYVRGGYRSQNASTMDVYDPRNGSFTSFDLPVFTPADASLGRGAAGVPIAQGYAATWCSQRSSILYFGGRFGSITAFVSPLIFEYIPANNTWAALPTTGSGPGKRESACIVTDQTCSKLVVFGGLDTETVYADIYILDLATMQWTVGPSLATGRVGMSCTLYDDGFLSWGGASDFFLTNIYGPSPSLFNLTTMKWTSSYKMTDSGTHLPMPTNESGKGVALALVLGLSIGATGLAAITVGILLYRRERRKAAKHYGRIHGRERDPTESGQPKDTSVQTPVEQKAEVVEGSENSGAITQEPDPRSREQGKRQWQQSLGHKVELCSSLGYDGVAAELDIVSQNKQEDPSFIPQTTASVGPMSVICPPASIILAPPLGGPMSLADIAPLDHPAVAIPSAPIARDIDFSVSETVPSSPTIRAKQTSHPSPFNPDFLRYTQSSLDNTNP